MAKKRKNSYAQKEMRRRRIEAQYRFETKFNQVVSAIGIAIGFEGFLFMMVIMSSM